MSDKECCDKRFDGATETFPCEGLGNVLVAVETAEGFQLTGSVSRYKDDGEHGIPVFLPDPGGKLEPTQVGQGHIQQREVYRILCDERKCRTAVLCLQSV